MILQELVIVTVITTAIGITVSLIFTVQRDVREIIVVWDVIIVLWILITIVCRTHQLLIVCLFGEVHVDLLVMNYLLIVILYVQQLIMKIHQ
jgi:hypothetical protein